MQCLAKGGRAGERWRLDQESRLFSYHDMSGDSWLLHSALSSSKTSSVIIKILILHRVVSTHPVLSEDFTYGDSFNLHNDSMRQVLLLPRFYRWGN